MFALLFHSLPRYDAPNSIDHPLVNWGPGRPEQALDLAQTSEQLFDAILHGNKKPARGGLVVVMDGEDLRRALGAPLGVVFWTFVLALWARRKKSTSADAREPHKAVQRGYLLGRKVRALWDLCVQRRRRV